jgi:hypothetical protein
MQGSTTSQGKGPRDPSGIEVGGTDPVIPQLNTDPMVIQIDLTSIP